MDSDEEMHSENELEREGKKPDSAMDVDDEIDEMDADELDDELELPRELSSLTVKEKRNLLRFKRSHNEIEWEEEIVRRTENLARKTDLERLKQMKNAQSKDSGAASNKKKAPASASKRSTKAIIPTSDDEDEDNDSEEEDEEVLPKRKGRGAKPAAKAAAVVVAKARGRGGKRLVVESESEEEDKPASDDEGKAEEDAEEEEEEDDDDDDAGDDDEESDDLFDSEEEEEITKRGRVSAMDEDDEDEDDGGKKSKKLRKGSRTSKRKSRSAWDDDEDEEDEDDEDLEEEEEETSGRGKRGARYVDDNKYKEDGDLGRIKNAFRTNRQKEADQQRVERQHASKPVVFNSLDDYKRHLLQRGIQEKDTGKGYVRETPVSAKEDDNDLADYTDYLQIFLRREDIARVLREPFFDEYIQGCFVRYLMQRPGQAPTYRACQIVDVVRTERAYKLGTSKGDVEARVLLTLDNQGVTVAGNKLDKVSNHTLTEDEVNKHITGLVERKLSPLTKREIRVKRQRMRDFIKGYVYSNEEIQSMIAARTGLNKVFATDYTTASAELQKTLAKATQEKDFELMESTQKEIEKLNYENERQKKIYEKTYKVHAEVNRKMREMNTKRDMEAGMRKRREDQELAAQGKLSNSVTDPFIRRETRPKNLWISNSKRPTAGDGADEANTNNNNNTTATTTDTTDGHGATKPLTTSTQFGVNDDAWPIPLVVDLGQMRKTFKRRYAVDPLEDSGLTKQARYLKKVMRDLPAKGSVEREQLRGESLSLERYLAHLEA